jgi:glyoxylase-like metal-dependent hydrolase (beta-lactamase superfamily II)
MLADVVARGEDPVDDWREIVVTPPTVLVGDRMAVDLGDRQVELVHLGRGHTDNDLMVHVPGAAAGVDAGSAVAEAGHRWPFPGDGMAAAVRDGVPPARGWR